MNQPLGAESAGSSAVAPRASGIDAARSRYLSMIDERLLTFEAYAADLRAARRQDAALVGISALAHKISGVSETIGFPRVGEIASDLELLIEHGRAANSSPASIWTKAEPIIEGLMETLEALLDY